MKQVTVVENLDHLLPEQNDEFLRHTHKELLEAIREDRKVTVTDVRTNAWDFCAYNCDGFLVHVPSLGECNYPSILFIQSKVRRR